MTARFSIEAAVSAQDLRDVAGLLTDYAAWLPIPLDYQDFGDEMATLPGKYAAPDGALLLARGPGGEALGCVALRSLAEPGVAEVKRLYTVPGARGMGLGRALAKAVVAVARTAGYQEVRLDTLSSMDAALALYRGLGFREIDPYYAPTPPGTIFMGLRL